MHYSDDELATFRKDRSQAAARATIEAHLAECSDCRETAELFAEFDESLRDPGVWDDVPVFLPPARCPVEILAAKASIEKENAEAVRKLTPHLKSPLHFEDADVAGTARFHDAGVVRMLTAEAVAVCERNPKFALQLATAALEIARKLATEPARSRELLVAIAHRERANALRLLGKFRDAIAALDESEHISRRMPHSVFDIAIVQYIRATVVIEFEERAGKALELARSAIQTFREYGDQQRELAARLVEAESLRIVSGSAQAAAAYEEVIILARKVDRNDILAHACHNAASAYAELGQLDRSERYYAEALARHEEQGNAVGKANCEWELARVLVLRGQLESGVRALEAARCSLFQLGLREDHGLATLDWAGAQLALNRPEGVAEACREIIPHYTSEGATKNARLALAYVHEALRHGTATPTLIRHVRHYLTQLPRHPSAAFQPPA
jgi:tetratricopeptide (TPR) repeat protein